MASGDSKQFGFCNLFIKFALFVMNFIVWLLGCVLLAIGIYTQVEGETLRRVGLGTVLTSPGIVLIILGGVIFIVGLCGCLGALREIYILLVIYAIVLSVIAVAEVGLGIYIYVAQDQARQGIINALTVLIENYNNNIDLQNIIDLVQGMVLQCCGLSGPDDWQRNIYFNCSSIAFQRCSVPFSCCVPEAGEDMIINVQCGYRTLNNTPGARMIYETGCVSRLEQYLYVILGVGIGLLVFLLINVLLSSGLAVDVHKEKQVMKAHSQQQKQEKRQEQAFAKM